MIYLELFWVFIQVGFLSIGGGYAAIPIINNLVVYVHGWISQSQFADLLAMAEITPGPIGIDTATFVGFQIAGVPGAIIANIGFVLPGYFIVLIMAFFYFKFKSLDSVQNVLKGLRPVMAALVSSAGLFIAMLAFWGAARVYDIRLSNTDFASIFIFLTAFVVIKRFKKLSPILVMLGSGVLGIVASLLPFL